MKEIIPIIHPKFQEKYPGWYSLVEYVKSRRFTVKDVIKYTGLTKRKVTYLIERGFLAKEDNDIQKWNRFSLIDIFILSIINGLRSKGIELDLLPLKLGKIAIDYSESTEPFVSIINGENLFLLTDLENIIGFQNEDQEYRKFIDSLNPECSQREHLSMRLKDVSLTRGSHFFIGLSLKEISDRLIKRLDLPDFKVIIQNDGKYQFIIKGIPLKLESLESSEEEKEEMKKIEEFNNNYLNRRA